jgi:hypothetical protein
MRKILSLATTVASIAVFAFILNSQQARAGELEPIAGASIKLGDVLGSAFYTVEPDGFHLVTTLASGIGTTPVRLVTTLLPDQKVTVSAPSGVGEPEIQIEFHRIKDRLFVDDATELSGIAN